MLGVPNALSILLPLNLLRIIFCSQFFLAAGLIRPLFIQTQPIQSPELPLQTEIILNATVCIEKYIISCRCLCSCFSVVEYQSPV